MKYITLFIFSTFLFFGQIDHTNKENDWSKMGLKGKVYLLEEKNLSFTITYFFNKNGYIEKIVNDNEEIFMKYDTLANKIEEKAYSKTNKQLNQTKSISYKDNFPQFIRVFNNQGEKTWETELEYTNNKVSKEIEYDNNQIDSYYEYKYDNNGNSIEIKKFNAKNELKLKNTYKFDKKNNKIEFSIYDWKTDKILETNKYVYNDKNEIIYIYKFDGNNKPISKNKYSYNYKFDLKGNWTYSAKYINKTMQKNTETHRKIEYYK